MVKTEKVGIVLIAAFLSGPASLAQSDFGDVPVYDPMGGQSGSSPEMKHEISEELKSELRSELRQTLGRELRQEFNQEMRVLKRQLRPVLASNAADNRAIGATNPDEAEPWKGRPSEREWGLGVLAGMATVDGTVGLATLGTAAKKIVHHGFVPDLNNQVFIETQIGPLFVSSEVGVQYSAHLRWDFQKDEEWIFYGLAGLGGLVIDLGAAGTSWRVYPRTGIGTLWKVGHQLRLRGELSHELIGLGVVFDL